MLLQCLSVLALWAFLQCLGLSPGARGAVFAAVFFSNLFILHSFFVWPKLLAAAFCFAPAAYILGARFNEVRNNIAIGALCGLSAALAMLSHGGSAFALAGVGLSALFLRRMPGFRFLMVAALVFAVVYGPWMAYQKFIDPPGDRLVKWHLGGVIDIDERSPAQTIVQEYKKKGAARAALDKLKNMRVLFGKPTMYVQDISQMAGYFFNDSPEGLLAYHRAATRVKWQYFFFFFIAMGVYALWPLAVVFASFAARTESNARLLQQAQELWMATFLGLLVWCLLMFIPHSTLIHQGSLFLLMLAMCGAALLYYRLSPILAWGAAVLQMLIHIILYLPPYTAIDATPAPVPEFNILLPMTAWLGAFIVWAALLWPERTSEP